MPPLINCLAYAGAGVFLFMFASTLFWTSATFLCRWVGKLVKGKRSRKTKLDMEANCNITPLILQPRRPTPRYAPHPPRCSCPVHASSHLSHNLHLKQLGDPGKECHNDVHISSASSLESSNLVLSSSDDNASGSGYFRTLVKSQNHRPEEQHELPQSSFTRTNSVHHKQALRVDSKSDLEYDMPKALSIAHSTVIRRRTGIFASEGENDDYKNSITVPPVLWALLYPSKIGLVLASGLLAKFSGERRKEDDCSEDVDSLHRIADAFGRQTSSRTDRYRGSLARSSRISGMRYEGGYKQGLHTVAYRCHLLKTARRSIQEISTCRASVFPVPVVITPIPAPPEPSLIVTVVPRNSNPVERTYDPATPPGLDFPPPPKAIGRGHTRGSRENMPPYRVGRLMKMRIPNKIVEEPSVGENKRHREVLGLKVVNQ